MSDYQLLKKECPRGSSVNEWRNHKCMLLMFSSGNEFQRAKSRNISYGLIWMGDRSRSLRATVVFTPLIRIQSRQLYSWQFVTVSFVPDQLKFVTVCYNRSRLFTVLYSLLYSYKTPPTLPYHYHKLEYECSKFLQNIGSFYHFDMVRYPEESTMKMHVPTPRGDKRGRRLSGNKKTYTGSMH
jgi:hypothetical protein